MEATGSVFLILRFLLFGRLGLLVRFGLVEYFGIEKNLVVTVVETEVVVMLFVAK